MTHVSSKLSEAQQKKRLLSIYGRWGRLARGLLAKSEESDDVDPEAHLAAMTKKARSLLNHKRWISLTKKLVQRGEKVKRLHVVSKWRLLARRLLEEEGYDDVKLQRLRITGRWLKLSKKLLNKSDKMHSLHVLGRWRQLTYKLTQKEERVQHLFTLGRWRRLTNKLLRQDEAEMMTRLRWVRLVKGLNEAVPGEFVMKSFEDLKLSAIIEKLKAKNEKTRQLRVIGKWRRLTEAVLRGDVAPSPKKSRGHRPVARSQVESK
mmetsp:Transcript_1309/g.1659  ORF Transcript_1309/g.1659 Transcript_1309/m.1659 type:complete len:262 (-) Transcript_1309:3049-3834(-)